MTHKNVKFLLPVLMLAGLTAGCANIPPEAKVKYTGQYWQRVDSSSALYLRGPKAQEMLNQDISRCTSDIREMERLGALKERVPANNDPYKRPPDPLRPDGHLAKWDSPEKDGYLYTEFLDYHDFEGCMLSKGWERVESVPYDVSKQARENYIDVITNRKYQTVYESDDISTPKQPGEYDNLNK